MASIKHRSFLHLNYFHRVGFRQIQIVVFNSLSLIFHVGFVC